MRLRPRSTVLPLRARVMAGNSSTGSGRGPGHRPSRLAAHHLAVLLAKLPGLQDRPTQVPLALAGLVAEQVLLAGLAALDLPRGRHPEAFLRALVRLHLGHGRPLMRSPPAAR